MKRKPLGALTDEPEDILRIAREELRQAKASNPYAVRQAAEKTYLAIASALERAVGRTIRSGSGQQEALSQLAKRDKKLAKQFNELKKALHGDCFHQARCEALDVAEEMGKATTFLSRLPKKV